jgi:elongation factor Ts
MATITAAMVKELRERTGLGMMDCKKALTDAGGDMERAIDDLRKSSALKAAKKAGRTAADGLLGVRVADDGRVAAMVEVNIETDFAARNDKFIGFVDKVLSTVFEQRSDDVAALLAAGLEDARQRLVQEIGENVTIRRAVVFETADGRISSYLHSDNRKAALVELRGGKPELGREIAMHVTASSPLVVTGAQVPADVIERERDIYVAQARESGKPDDIVSKMVEGRIRKYLADVSLVDQPFVKDPDTKVGRLLADQKAECVRFARYEVGEGIEKAESDFAAEVAAQVQARS